jgi:flagellar capping protein FliD
MPSPDPAALHPYVIMTAIVCGMLTTIATTIATLIVQGRNRQHDLEDRRTLAASLELRHNMVAAEQSRLRGEIQTNTILTQQSAAAADSAFKEANHVNLKIAALATVAQQNLEATRSGADAAGSAYHEANSVNVKIASLEERLALAVSSMKPWDGRERRDPK